MHHSHRQQKDSPRSCSACVRSTQESRNSLPRFRPDGESRAVALPWQACLRQLACPAHRFQSTNTACEALFGYACLDLSRLGVTQPMLGVALVLGKSFGSLFVLRLRPLLNVEQPPCLCNLSIRDAISRLTIVMVAWAGWVRPIDMICFLVKTSAPFTSFTCARPTLLYCETQSNTIE
jgi:hypothetical protein